MPCSFIIQRMAHNLQICGATQCSRCSFKAPAYIGLYLGCVLYIHLCTIYTSLKWLLYQEFKLSQGTCVFLEKLLILFRHFILQFMYLPSATNKQWCCPKMTFLKRPVSVNTSKQQLY